LRDLIHFQVKWQVRETNMPPANVIQLRQLLSEKFPRLHSRTKSLSREDNGWLTGIPRIDDAGGGLPKGAITEVVAEERNCGSATLLQALIVRAAVQNQIVTIIDGNDTLDVAGIDPAVLSRILWVRCRSSEEALKAADIVLRDNNLSFVLVDLVSNPPAQLRKISPTIWYRFQRLLEDTSTVCAVFTPRPMVNPAVTRIALKSRLSLDALQMEFTPELDGIDLSVLSMQHVPAVRQNLAG
jgi:hypothetical protein